MVVGEKKSWALRVCIDPKYLNQALRRSHYQLPTMEADVLPKLAHARVFSVVDVKNGYWHVKLDQQASKLTTFGTPYGRYRWARLPFGVSVAPELFQRKLDKELEGLSNVAKIADDILVWGNGQDANEAYPDHDAHMSHLLRKMDAAGVKLNPEKLVYRRRKVIFAGYALSDDGALSRPVKSERYSTDGATFQCHRATSFLWNGKLPDQICRSLGHVDGASSAINMPEREMELGTRTHGSL